MSDSKTLPKLALGDRKVLPLSTIDSPLGIFANDPKDYFEKTEPCAYRRMYAAKAGLERALIKSFRAPNYYDLRDFFVLVARLKGKALESKSRILRAYSLWVWSRVIQYHAYQNLKHAIREDYRKLLSDNVDILLSDLSDVQLSDTEEETSNYQSLQVSL